MSLRTKFGVLLGLLGLSVVLALGASWWAMRNMQSEVREPFRSMTDALTGLSNAKRSLESAHDVLDPTNLSDSRQDRPGVAQAISAANRYVDELAANDWSRTRIGVSTIPNMHARLNVAAALATTDPEMTPDESIRRALRDIHELIERTEGRVVEDAQQALRFGSDLERQLLIVLALCLLIAALGIALGFSLVRRWVLRPVANLREATARIGAGDFEHRVAIPVGNPDELALLSAEVNTMAGLVKAAQDQRVESERLAAIGEMVRRLAHNLRNPLAGIRGLAEISRAELRARTPAEPDLTENQDRIITAVDRFEHWLNELLGVTRPMQVLLVPTPVAPWLKALVAAHDPQARAKQITLTLDTSAAPTEAPFDPRHLEHALSAVISNAIEAASVPPKAPPTPCHVCITARSGSTLWTIQVDDTGPGIPKHIQDKIFRPYFTTKRDGNGIGLAIALQVVQAHGGRLSVVSPIPRPPSSLPEASKSHEIHNGREPDRGGTRFLIELPTNRPALANESALGLASFGQTGVSIGQDSRH
jgi:signal transduction histidine kinase